MSNSKQTNKMQKNVSFKQLFNGVKKIQSNIENKVNYIRFQNWKQNQNKIFYFIVSRWNAENINKEIFRHEAELFCASFISYAVWAPANLISWLASLRHTLACRIYNRIRQLARRRTTLTD